MKKSIVSLCAALAAGVVLSVRATEAQWTFDGSMLTDGDWVFSASVNGTDLTVNAVQSDPGEGATLDLSKPIADGYVIVKLNPNFSAYDNRAHLATLVLPEKGLTTISANAFKNCTSLTSITPFLPDSVTTLGGSAFYSVPVEAPVVMMGVTSVPNGTFQYSGITEATFGPNLKTISGGWVSGSFDHCSNLAKLNFDPNMSGAAISGSDEFAYCSKLSGTVDLSGFTSLSGRIFYTYGGSISKLILSSDLASADPGVFDYLNTLKSVEFTAGVPKDKNFYKMYNNTSRVTLSSVITTVKEEYKDEWAAYCEGGSINKIDSQWRLDLVPSAAAKGFYLVYKGQGGGGELGDWIFNGETVTNVTYGWGFAATTAGQLLFLGNCTQYPEEPSPLDFTTRITDEDGNEMGISTYAKLFHNGTDNTPSLPGAEKVLSVVLPLNCPIVGNNAFRGCTNMVSATLHDKISTIEANAFRDCKALMTVTPCLPDSLTELGSCAFMQCALGFDCRLAGISTIGSSAIRATQLRSLFVGKTVKTIGGGYTNGGISYNTELTNLTFEAGVTNATLQGEHTLCHNEKLAGEVDLSGFSSIGGGRPLDGAKITNLTFSAQLASIPGTVLEGLSQLRNLYFLGPPPTNVGLIFDQQGRVARIGKNQDVRTYVYRAYADQWKVYAKDEVLDGKHSTWSPEYLADEVTDLSKRKLLLVDPPPGLMLIIK